MTAPAVPAAHADHLTLDAAAALRADLASQPSPPSPAALPHALQPATPPAADAPPDPSLAPGAWLLLVTSIERAAQLPARERPAHFRRARAVWDDAGAALAQPRYAAIGTRLGRWRTSDPTLPLVKELLWAVEQPEAAGYTHLALAGCSALARLIPADDARRGYVLAQSARALRTLGDVDGARERYTVSERLGAKHRDRWLRVRSAVGLGATYQQIGNHSAARAIYNALLTKGSPDPRFTAIAHHGLVLAAIAAEDWDAALAHGWHLLRAGRRGIVPRVDVLLLMAGVCRRIGRYRAAVRAAEAGLEHAARAEDPLLAHKIMADVALDTGDRARGLEHAAVLRTLVYTGAGPFEDAKALFTLGLVEERWGSRRRALADTTRAYDIALGHRYHELAFKLEAVQQRLLAAPPAAPRAARPESERPRRGEVVISSESQRIVTCLLSLDTHDVSMAAGG